MHESDREADLATPTAADTAYLLWALRRHFGTVDAQAAPVPSTGEGVYAAARLNKVGNLVQPISDVFDAKQAVRLRSMIDDYRRRTIRLNSATLGVLLEVAEVLEDAGIAFAVAKGPAATSSSHRATWTFWSRRSASPMPGPPSAPSDLPSRSARDPCGGAYFLGNSTLSGSAIRLRPSICTTVSASQGLQGREIRLRS
jgi:hypothetical protein